MKTNNLNMRSSRMRTLTKMANYGGSNIQTLFSNQYIVPECMLPKMPMDPIPWSNVTFETIDNGYIIRYSGDARYIYFGLYPNTRFITMNDINSFITINDNPNTVYITCGYVNAKMAGRIESDVMNLGIVENSGPLRIIIMVRNNDNNNDIGYFYVDVDANNNVKLST